MAPSAASGQETRFGDQYAIYGYEAMKLILDGLDAAGPSREALVKGDSPL